NLFIGIYLSNSFGNIISNNVISGNDNGISMEYSNINTITNNTITENENGLYLHGEEPNPIAGNAIIANTVSNNTLGISLTYSENNLVYHNNFVNNSNQAYTFDSEDLWDWEGEGNYWSDYAGEDSNFDAIGETPYQTGDASVDNYPLVGVFHSFSFTWETETFHVSVISASKIVEFSFVQPEKKISLNVTESGFCKVTFPTVLLGGPYTVLADSPNPVIVVPTSDDTHAIFYIIYNQDTNEIQIKGSSAVPEFSSIPLLLAAMLLVLTMSAIAKKNSQRLVKRA
ncbi:MAG TPA: NosD domain-containing protein, partial [Candidatus Bathyarchaeia archaeon]